MAKPAQMTAFLGRSRRLGLWQIPPKSTVFALFGSCHLDMRQAYADKELEQVKMKVTSIFGGVEIIVPDGVEVRPSGAAFLASSNFEVPKLREDASLPPIILDSLTVFGRLRLHTVITEAEAAARDAEKARLVAEAIALAAPPVVAQPAPVAAAPVAAQPVAAAPVAAQPVAAAPVAAPAPVVEAPPAEPVAEVDPEVALAEKKAAKKAALAKKIAEKKARQAAEGEGSEDSEDAKEGVAA